MIWTHSLLIIAIWCGDHWWDRALGKNEVDPVQIRLICISRRRGIWVERRGPTCTRWSWVSRLRWSTWCEIVPPISIWCRKRDPGSILNIEVCLYTWLVIMTLEEVSLTSTPGSDWSSPPLLTLTVLKLEPTASERNLWKNVCASVSLTVY